MPTILVTGAASGLGRAFVQAWAERLSSASAGSNTEAKDSTIYALDRGAIDVAALFPAGSSAAAWATSHVQPLTLDITDEDAVASLFAKRLEGEKLDLVIHSAGIRGLVDDGRRVAASADVARVETAEAMDARTLRKAFDVNAVGSFLVLRACVPGLRRAAAASAAAAAGENVGEVRPETSTAKTEISQNGIVSPGRVPKVVVMGSRMGSIGHNVTGGGAYAYRASKAALNAVVKSFSIDVPEAVWIVIHPGRVETGLVRVKEDGAMSVEQSVNEMMPLTDALTLADSGRFVDRFGQDVPW